MKTEHNAKIQDTTAVQNIHQYSVDIIERTCKIITAYKINVGACPERNRLLRKLFTSKQMSGAVELKHILVLSL